MIIRNADYNDIETLKSIWKERFRDEDCFIEWFFKERFIPEHSTIIEADRKIVSCLYSMPTYVNVRNHKVKALLLSGVSTLPEYEGIGLMKKAVTHHLSKMRNQGYHVSILKPVKPAIYYSLEHREINEAFEVRSLSKLSSGTHVKIINISAEYRALYDCYSEYSEKYSGMFFRTYDDFIIKCREYEQTGADCLAYFEEDTIKAYCCYYKEDGKLSVE